MARVSWGLFEWIILGGGAAFLLLVAAIIIGMILKKRKANTTSATSRSWLWIIAVILILAIVVPIAVVVLGILVVTPVRQVVVDNPEMISGGEAVVVVTTPLPAQVMPEGTVIPSSTPVITTPPETRRPFKPLDPASPVWFASLLIIAGAINLICVLIITPVIKRWQMSMQLENEKNEVMEGDSVKKEKIRYVSLIFLSWLALSILFVMDFLFAISTYLRVLVIYVTFWVLVAVLLLLGKAVREKLLILVILVVLLFSVRFITWNSRKAFLRDFNHIEAGMTADQVEQLMGKYMMSEEVPAGSPEIELDEEGKIINGTLIFRHTEAGWGNADLGVATFVDGIVLETHFMPD